MRLEIVIVRYTRGVFNILASQRVVMQKVILSVICRFIQTDATSQTNSHPRIKTVATESAHHFRTFESIFIA